jgi:hypothetical protein
MFSVGTLGRCGRMEGADIVIAAPPSRLSGDSLLSTLRLSKLFSFEPHVGYLGRWHIFDSFTIGLNIFPIPYILRDDDTTLLNLGGMTSVMK